MVQEYSIRPYEAGDEEGIVQLLQLVFNGWPSFDLDCSPVDHWRWKYLHSPAERSLIFVGEGGGKIVGCSHIYTVNLKIGERIIKCGLGADAAVHPDQRGRGLWKSLAEARKAQEIKSWLGFRMGLTSSESIVRHHIRTQRDTIPYGLANFMRIRDVGLHLRRMKASRPWSKKYVYQLMRKINSFSNYSRYAHSVVDIYPVKAFDDRVKAFWSRASRQYDLILERSPEYLNWRYCDGRAGRFTVKLAGEG